MKIAAIDIGSNSIKLVVVDAAASDSFAVLAREKDMVRLGHDTLRQGRLSPSAIDLAVECITRFRSIAEARGAERIVAVATASVREANNSAQFIKEVQRKAGVQRREDLILEAIREVGSVVELHRQPSEGMTAARVLDAPSGEHRSGHTGIEHGISRRFQPGTEKRDVR